MVPDVKYNEAYISFVLVHPEWRRGGIGTYMIYHLIQTCMGKDVTLHVSVTNPAMLLYQKFGFKPEEFILDFYSRYLPEDSSQCRHAYFLRLRRWIICMGNLMVCEYYLQYKWWFVIWLIKDSKDVVIWCTVVICILTTTSKLWTTEWLWSEYILPNFKQGRQLDETWTTLSWLKVVKTSTYFRRWMPGCAAGQFLQQVLLPNTHTVLSCTHHTTPHPLCCTPPPPTPPHSHINWKG